MALPAAAIGEKVFQAQAMMALYRNAAAEDFDHEPDEGELVTAALEDLLHYANSYGYDPQALLADAQSNYQANITGPAR